MYHNGYVETLPVQLPEVTDRVRDYFSNYYNTFLNLKCI